MSIRIPVRCPRDFDLGGPKSHLKMKKPRRRRRGFVCVTITLDHVGDIGNTVRCIEDQSARLQHRRLKECAAFDFAVDFVPMRDLGNISSEIG